MKSKIKMLVLAATLVAVAQLPAQNKQGKSTEPGGQSGYKTGIGLRFGPEAGLTLKHFLNKNAVEVILSSGWGYGGFRLTGLYEVHKPFPSVKGLDWFFGGGAHVGTYSGRYYGYSAYNGGYHDKNGKWHPDYRSRYMTLGIDGILGLEYLFEDFPITIGLDIKPYIDLIGWGNHFADGAFTIRYAIK
jgi:hypothetical protein